MSNNLETRGELEATLKTLSRAIIDLWSFIVKEGYRGYDPYDFLSSPVFDIPVLNQSRFLRWASQQVARRLPLNVRPIFGIRKGYNPVTLGLCLHAYVLLRDVLQDQREILHNAILFCVDELDRLRSKGYSGSCWGYDFDWEARRATLPAFTPTIAATGCIVKALFECYAKTGHLKARELCLTSADFVNRDLRKTTQRGLFCYSYSPRDSQMVLNATMEAARVLVHVSCLTGDYGLLQDALSSVHFVMQHQRADGSWPYSVGDGRLWSDNFHTGYVLDSLDDIMRLTGIHEFKDQLQKGLEFYLSHFVYEGCIPKYYHNALYPVDSTSAAQCILTHLRFGRIETANRIASWMIENMRDESGYFYYRKHRCLVNKTSYMRWSNAWMFLALSRLSLSVKSDKVRTSM